MGWIRGLLFLVGATAVFWLMHHYVWVRVGRDTRLPRSSRRWIRSGLTLLGLTLPLGWGLGRWLDAAPGTFPSSALAMIAFLWLGVLYYWVIALGIWDAARWTLRLRKTASPATDTPANPARRALLARVGAAGATLVTGSVSVAGYYSGAGDITTPEVMVRIPRLPVALSGLRIALLSDIHIGPLLDGRFLRGVVEKTNALRPDLIAIVGDLVDGSVAQLGPHVAMLGGLRARYGTHFVTGNHEYYSGADAWTAFLTSLGIRVLSNERVRLGDAGASIELAGVPDHRAHAYGGARADMQKAAVGRDPNFPLIMLAHQPVQIEQAVAAGVDLQLSGHTHGGQMFPFGGLTRLVQPYLAGLHQHAPETQIYVSRGTGFWGPPMRVLAPAEITSLVLVP